MTLRASKPFGRRGLTLDGCSAFPVGRGGSDATIKVKARLYVGDAGGDPVALLDAALRDVIQEMAAAVAVPVSVRSVEVTEATTTDAYRTRVEANLENEF
ncbi:hypothetical protein QDR37_01245 [Amnibacterium sp. CER49]|uniref:hypothetical protein n=1 Tax=Amnibacterium sp. CER49 TaxID=3039161 RepID=UPI002448AFD4|nr:hypothetical protein [Amnibacterium sp. CER49]MDH2442559.1 hypothetical protein [Amnibacterium sp. CER49]